MRTLVIREINALKINVKRFDESCILKCSSNLIFYCTRVDDYLRIGAC